jgi:selenocysteine-specific elongation factor
VILGTAGHVDHGKTTLVKALTGIDTDRLPEEKRRGITLELGFAHLDLPGVGRVGVVDVPGHEKFVKAMAAGAGGVDAALLVVAVDEGVMPQTREHIDICRLLEVRKGRVVITKADMLPALGEGWLDLLKADLGELTRDTVFEGEPLLVSAKSGEGIDALRLAIAAMAKQLAARPADGPAFLPIDRAFTVKGFGAVVTGTLLSGKLNRDDAVSLSASLPGPFRARTLQVHGAAVDSVAAGQRVAVNLAGVEAQQIQRGMAVVREHELPPARTLDVELTLLASADKPLPRRSRQLLSLGTAHANAAVRLIDTEGLRPGESCFAQVTVGSPLAALPGQRFILRGSRVLEGRGATLGGGKVLALNSARRRKGSSTKLEALAQAEGPQRIAWLLTEAGYAGLTEKELFARATLAQKELSKLLEAAAAQGRALLVDKDARRYLGPDVFKGLTARALAMLEAFHAQFPEKEGLPREELRQKLGVPHERTFLRLLAALTDSGKAEVVAELVRLAGRRGRLDEKGSSLKDALDAALHKGGLAPPTHGELAVTLKAPVPRIEELLKVLVQEGRAHKAGDLHFHAAAITALEAKLVDHLKAKEAITTSEFKDLVGGTRKFVIPLAELFDARKVTLRVGEKRVLRKR